MKLNQAIIYNYRSIGKEFKIVFNPKSTVLVGKSNVGKSNILDAISFAFDDKPLNNDYLCSWKNVEEDDCIDIIFTIKDRENKILSGLSKSLKGINKLIIRKKLSGKKIIDFVPDVIEEIIHIPPKQLKSRLANLRSRIRKAFRNWELTEQELVVENKNLRIIDEFDDLRNWVNDSKKLELQDNEDTQNSNLDMFYKKLHSIRIKLDGKEIKDYDIKGIKRSISNIMVDTKKFRVTCKYIEKKILPYNSEEILELLPEIIHIRSNDQLDVKDSIFVEEFDKSGSNLFMKKLLDLSQINYDVLKTDNGRKIAALIVEANKNIKNSLTKYWNQENLQIELRYNKDTINGKVKPKIELDFIGQEGHRGSLDDQSPGFHWFLAFVVNYLVGIPNDKHILLILDEPGIHLHAGAQYDLLERFENTSNNIQVIYTTHSPYMINKNFPHRIISVKKGDQVGVHILIKNHITPPKIELGNL